MLIKGWFVPNKNPQAKTIVLLHGYPADKGDILPSRLFLHAKYHLLFLDFRYLGESQGSYTTIGKYEVRDLRAALNYLHSKGINEVGVWGLSLGASVALMTATDAPEIKAIIAETPYARLDWIAYDYYTIPGLNYIMGHLLQLYAKLFLNIDVASVRPVDAVTTLQIPLLLIFNKDDHVITYEHALLMQQAAKNNPKAEIIIIDRRRHGQLIENYRDIILQFFAKHL